MTSSGYQSYKTNGDPLDGTLPPPVIPDYAKTDINLQSFGLAYGV